MGVVVVWILASSSPLANSPLPWESEVTQTTGHKQEWWNGYWEKIVLLLLLLVSSYWLKCVCGCAREHEGSLGNIINNFQLFCNSLKLIDTLTIRKPSSFFMKYITFWLSKRTRIFLNFSQRYGLGVRAQSIKFVYSKSKRQEPVGLSLAQRLEGKKQQL